MQLWTTVHLRARLQQLWQGPPCHPSLSGSQQSAQGLTQQIVNARKVGPTHFSPYLPQDPEHCNFVGERNSISAKLDSWQRELETDEDGIYFLDRIKLGFRIIRESSNVTPVEQKNHRCAFREKNSGRERA